MNKEKYNQIIDEAYEDYEKHIETQRDIQKEEVKRLRSQRKLVKVGLINLLSKEEFINKCKTDSEFSKKWGLKIEERELSLEERVDWLNKNYPMYGLGEWTIEQLSYSDYLKEVEYEYNIPTKLITITYNNETIEIYE